MEGTDVGATTIHALSGPQRKPDHFGASTVTILLHIPSCLAVSLIIPSAMSVHCRWHLRFDLDGDLATRLSYENSNAPKVAMLLKLQVLLLDEVPTTHLVQTRFLAERSRAPIALCIPPLRCR